MDSPSTKKSRNPILTNIVHFSGSNLYRHFLGLLTSLFRPMALGPELYGLWNLLNITTNYGTYLHLGSRTSMRYAIPKLRSREEHALIEQTKGTVITGTMLINGFIACILIAIAGFGDYTGASQHGLILFALILVLSCFYEHSISELKGEQNFLLVSQANYVRYSLNFVLTAALIFQFQFYGAVAALLLSIVLSTLFLGRGYSLTRPGRFDLTLFIQQVKFGWPIVILDVVTLLLRSIDKLLIALYIGTHALGLYAIATMILGPLMNIPAASREVVEQALMFKGDTLSQKKLLNDFFFKPLRYTAYLMPVLIGVACLVLPGFIQIALADYRDAILATQILLTGSYFLALSYPCRGVIVANNWQIKAALHAVVAALINLALSFYLLQRGLGIEAVAASSSFSFFVLHMILFAFVLKRSKLRFRDSIWQLPDLLLPFFVMLGLFLLVSYISAEMMSLDGLSASIVEVLLFMIFYAPFALIARKQGRF